MSGKPKILCVTNQDDASALPAQIQEACEVVDVHSPLQALSMLANQHFDGLMVAGQHIDQAVQLGGLLQHQRIIDGMPDGVALLDSNNAILWANACFREWVGSDDLVGTGFYAALENPEILGPDFCPFHTALVAEQSSCSTLQVGENTF